MRWAYTKNAHTIIRLGSFLTAFLLVATGIVEFTPLDGMVNHAIKTIAALVACLPITAYALTAASMDVDFDVYYVRSTTAMFILFTGLLTLVNQVLGIHSLKGNLVCILCGILAAFYAARIHTPLPSAKER